MYLSLLPKPILKKKKKKKEKKCKKKEKKKKNDSPSFSRCVVECLISRPASGFFLSHAPPFSKPPSQLVSLCHRSFSHPFLLPHASCCFPHCASTCMPPPLLYLCPSLPCMLLSATCFHRVTPSRLSLPVCLISAPARSTPTVYVLPAPSVVCCFSFLGLTAHSSSSASSAVCVLITILIFLSLLSLFYFLPYGVLPTSQPCPARVLPI